MAKATKAEAPKTKEPSPTTMTTGKVRFSYAHVFEPVSMQEGQGEKKYSVSLIIPKTDTATVQRARECIQAAQEIGMSKLWGGKLPPTLKLPLRDGDKERPDDEAYKNAYFMSATTKTKPGVVGPNPKDAIIDPTEFYSGCYGRANINFFAFAKAGSKGVACGLNHVQKLEEGEPLGGRGTAEEAFGSVSDEQPDDLLS